MRPEITLPSAAIRALMGASTTSGGPSQDRGKRPPRGTLAGPSRCIKFPSELHGHGRAPQEAPQESPEASVDPRTCHMARPGVTSCVPLTLLEIQQNDGPLLDGPWGAVAPSLGRTPRVLCTFSEGPYGGMGVQRAPRDPKGMTKGPPAPYDLVITG